MAAVEDLSGDPTELIVERTRVTLEQEEELDASTADYGLRGADSQHIAPTSDASVVPTALAPPEPSAIGKSGRVAVVAGAVLVLAAAAKTGVAGQRFGDGCRLASFRTQTEPHAANWSRRRSACYAAMQTPTISPRRAPSNWCGLCFSEH